MKNAISLAALSELAEEVRATPAQGAMRCAVALEWCAATRAELQALPLQLGDQRISRNLRWTIDEPRALGGSNLAPSPQEQLLGALAGCLMVAYVVAASVRGLQLDALSIELQAALDLGGFLGIRADAPVALQRIDYRFHVQAEAEWGVLEALRVEAEQRSPNAQTLQRALPLQGSLQRGAAVHPT